jgi:hypothetical protein
LPISSIGSVCSYAGNKNDLLCACHEEAMEIANENLDIGERTGRNGLEKIQIAMTGEPMINNSGLQSGRGVENAAWRFRQAVSLPARRKGCAKRASSSPILRKRPHRKRISVSPSRSNRAFPGLPRFAVLTNVRWRRNCGVGPRRIALSPGGGKGQLRRRQGHQRRKEVGQKEDMWAQMARSKRGTEVAVCRIIGAVST